jgi:lysozyme
MRTSPRGHALIKQFEGFSGKAYLCPAGVLTIGYGFTKHVKAGDTMTRAQADARLTRELREYEEAVEAAAGECNQNEFDAMVSLCWNIGPGNFARSTVAKAHKRGDHAAAGRAFGLWNKSGGKVLAGLARRRAAEAALYLDPVPDDESAPASGPVLEMPQKVDPESSLARSPIVTSTTLTTGAATLGVAAEAARSASDIRETLGDWLPWVLVGVAVVAGGFAIWQRVRQRAGGWA